MDIIIRTAAALAETPIGTTFTDRDGEAIVKTGPGQYAMAADLGKGDAWSHLDEAELIGVYHSDLPVGADREDHVPSSPFLPLTVNRLGGDRDGSVTASQS